MEPRSSQSPEPAVLSCCVQTADFSRGLFVRITPLSQNKGKVALDQQREHDLD